MNAKTRFVAAVAAVAAVLLALGARTATAANDDGATAKESARPNVVIILTDQHFADVMSCRMGDRLLRTPAMDRLAGSGTLFTRAYCANPLCMPSRTSMFSGYHPHQTGVTTDGRAPRGFDPTRFVCMGRRFRDAGYDAFHIGKWSMAFDLNDSSSHGFDRVAVTDKTAYDAAVTNGALAFLAKPREKPFLMVVSYNNPHNICQWTRRLAGRRQTLGSGEIGDPPPVDQLPPPPANLAPPRDEPDGMTLLRRAYQVEDGPFPVAKFTPDDWRKHRWGYYRMVELVDKEIGRLLDALRDRGLEENTLVVFTADHGECAGAHGFNQKTVFYEESVRVPLIVSWKGKTRGRTCDKLVGTGVDLLPTVCEASGVATPKDLPGRSLLPLALGKDVAAWREHVVVQNNMVQAGKLDGVKPTMTGRMLRSERYKYCLFSLGRQRESLVDLKMDPGEMNNLAADPRYREILLEHRRALSRWAKEQNDALTAELLAEVR